MRNYFTAIAEAVRSGDEKSVVQNVEDALSAGTAFNDILNKGLIPGIEALGELFKDGEAFLPEVLISARAMKSGVDKLAPLLASQDIPKKGNVVLGTVAGDMHDIGKNLVKMMLECNGYEVHDLGRDVPAEVFADAVREIRPDIVGISALLTTTMINIEEVVKVLEQSGIRNQVRVMIGGAPITRQFADKLSVEGYADDCVSAVAETGRLVELARKGG